MVERERESYRQREGEFQTADTSFRLGNKIVFIISEQQTFVCFFCLLLFIFFIWFFSRFGIVICSRQAARYELTIFLRLCVKTLCLSSEEGEIANSEERKTTRRASPGFEQTKLPSFDLFAQFPIAANRSPTTHSETGLWLAFPANNGRRWNMSALGGKKLHEA